MTACIVEMDELVEFILPGTCEICKYVPPGSIFHCPNNHKICEECRDKQSIRTKCSLCESAAQEMDSSKENSLTSFHFKLFGTTVDMQDSDLDETSLESSSFYYSDTDENLERDFDEENFLDSLSFECTYADYGCPKVYSRAEIYKHIEVCDLRSMCLRFGFKCKDCTKKFKVRKDLLYRVTLRPRTIPQPEPDNDISLDDECKESITESNNSP